MVFATTRRLCHNTPRTSACAPAYRTIILPHHAVSSQKRIALGGDNRATHYNSLDIQPEYALAA